VRLHTPGLEQGALELAEGRPGRRPTRKSPRRRRHEAQRGAFYPFAPEEITPEEITKALQDLPQLLVIRGVGVERRQRLRQLELLLGPPSQSRDERRLPRPQIAELREKRTIGQEGVPGGTPQRREGRVVVDARQHLPRGIGLGLSAHEGLEQQRPAAITRAKRELSQCRLQAGLVTAAIGLERGARRLGMPA